MARALSLLVPGGWYRVMSRGNRREDLFRDDDDCRRFLGLVSEWPERFRAVVIQDERGVCEVARYVHLNPVRIGGLGLGKAEQRRAKVLGSTDPGAALVAQRLAVLHGYQWSSSKVYSGADPKPEWLETAGAERSGGVAGDCEVGGTGVGAEMG